MVLGADQDNDADDQDLPRYIETKAYSAFPREDELLFYGKRCKFQIKNIYVGGFGKDKSHRKEVSALNVLQRLLENGKVEWESADNEVSLIQHYVDLKMSKYVILL